MTWEEKGLRAGEMAQRTEMHVLYIAWGVRGGVQSPAWKDPLGIAGSDYHAERPA